MKRNKNMWKFDRTSGFSLLLGMATFLSLQNPADAGCTYNRQAAVSYSNTYAQEGSYNTGYQSFSPSDCANFVSQCLINGGINIERFANSTYLAGYTGAKTIPNVVNLMSFLGPFSTTLGVERDRGSTSDIPVSTPTLYAGDVVTFYAPSLGWHHSAIVAVKYTDVGNYGASTDDDFLMNSHSTTSGAHNYQTPLRTFWKVWNTATFFNIYTTKEEDDETCQSTVDPPPTCGSLQKRWAPTASN
jgi:hypothetical protein